MAKMIERLHWLSAISGPRPFLLCQVLWIKIPHKTTLCDPQIIVLSLDVLCVRFKYGGKAPTTHDTECIFLIREF